MPESAPNRRSSSIVKGDIAGAHEHVIVFNSERPVRGEAVFEADADHATPAGFRGTVESDTGQIIDAGILVVSDGGTALHVQQHVVPSVTNLTGEQAEGVDFRVVAHVEIQQADVVALEIRPIP